MNDIRKFMRNRWPSAYKLLIRAAHRRRNALGLPQRLRARIVLKREDAVEVVVDQAVGLGGLLLNAGIALHVGDRSKCEIKLRFASPTYMPSWQPADFLDCYFQRKTVTPKPPKSIQARHLPGFYAPSFETCAKLVWDTLTIRDEYWAEAATYAAEPFVAVHYRGSDKFLEFDRADPRRVLEMASSALASTGANRVFIATDERSFLELARQEFGEKVFVLPSAVFADDDGLPAHFLRRPGEEKAREAILLMLILSKAQTCIRTESFLSQWAATLASENSNFVLVK